MSKCWKCSVNEKKINFLSITVPKFVSCEGHNKTAEQKTTRLGSEPFVIPSQDRPNKIKNAVTNMITLRYINSITVLISWSTLEGYLQCHHHALPTSPVEKNVSRWGGTTMLYYSIVWPSWQQLNCHCPYQWTWTNNSLWFWFFSVVQL